MSDTKAKLHFEQAVNIPSGNVNLEGELKVPQGANGVVLFAHGSGSSRHSPRNQFVAQTLNTGGLATLLFDLLTSEEEQLDLLTRKFRFDIDLLAKRTIQVTDWLVKQPEIGNLKLGYFGSSTGAAGALIAAAERPQVIHAVVSRGGRPDLANDALPRVNVPVLFIIGELDTLVLELNEQAMAQMNPVVERHLEIIPRATHLFEEPGALEQVAKKARSWFLRHLV